MVNLTAVNTRKPPQLLQEGVLGGESLDLQLSSITEHVHSRAATIYCGQSEKNGQFALKVVFAPDVREPHNIKKEIRLLSKLANPNICPLLNAYFVDSHYIIALPFYRITLQQVLDNPTFVPGHDEGTFTTTARLLIKQMCSATASLESHHIAHRDISPSNFLVSSTGHVVLTDFGVAYDAQEPGQEGTKSLQFELGTGPYRAPELLFGSRSYDPFAIDRWALGATIASFFTTIGPTRPPSPDSDDAQMSFMATLAPGPVVRSSLFEGGFSDFALIGSIFKTLGTPTLKTWPDAKDLPDFGKFTYREFPPTDLKTVSPNLPKHGNEAQGPVEIISGFLRYTFADRLKASDALDHPWFRNTQGDAKMPQEAASWFQ